MESTVLRDLCEYVEQLVDNQVEPEIIDHEGVDYTKLQEITDVAIGQLNIDGEIQEAPEPIVIGIDM